MKTRPSETPRATLGARIHAWWLDGRSTAEREIMGSSGEWDRSVGEPPEVMAGRANLDTAALPYLMSSPGTWNSSAARDS